MKYDWEKIRLYGDAHKGLDAIKKLTGKEPTIQLSSQEAIDEWERVGKMHNEFYKLDIQERLYQSGMATRPKEQE